MVTHDESLKKYFFPVKNTPHSCPKILQYQATEKLPFKISDKCCKEFKKKPFRFYEKQTGRAIAITGIRGAVGGIHEIAGCLTYEHGKVRMFNQLQPISEKFCQIFVALPIQFFNIPEVSETGLTILYYTRSIRYGKLRNGQTGFGFRNMNKKRRTTTHEETEHRCHRLWPFRLRHPRRFPAHCRQRHLHR